MRGLLFATVFAVPLGFVVGCGGATPPPPAANANPTEPTEVTLTEGGVADIDKAAKATKKAVVLVEFWSLATEPSPDLALAANTRGGIQQARGDSLSKDKVAWHGIRKAEFLGLKYEGFQLRVVSVNVDGPGKRDEVLKHLKTHEAMHVTNLALKDEPAVVAERYGFKGKAPHQVVYGRNGSRVWMTGEPLTMPLDDLLFQELDK